MRTSAALSFIILLATSAVAQAEDELITVVPWTIPTSSKADKFDICTMSRSTADLNVSIVRADDGLALLLDSSKWRLERGRAYEVTLVAGQRSVDARALAENRGVTIPLADRPFNEAMRTANVLEVRGEGTTLRVPLDGSIAALRAWKRVLRTTVAKVTIPILLLRQIISNGRRPNTKSARREMAW